MWHQRDKNGIWDSIGTESNLNDLRKAAVLLLSLPKQEAGRILSQLDSKQVKTVSTQMAQIGSVSSCEQENVICDFAEASPDNLSIDGRGLEADGGLIEKTITKNSNFTIDSVRQSVEPCPFGFLKKVDSQNLLAFIMHEHPQTIALILSHVNPSCGAEVLTGLKEETRQEVIRRIANMGQTNPDVIKDVERGLKSRMENIVSESYESAGGSPVVAEILNVTDCSIKQTLLENLAREDPELVEEIRRLMFGFEDITKLTNKDVQALLKNIEMGQWSTALQGGSKELREKIFDNMSTRAADILDEEMEFLGSVSLSKVKSVQQQIVDIIRKLGYTGQIKLPVPDGTEEFIL